MGSRNLKFFSRASARRAVGQLYLSSSTSDLPISCPLGFLEGVGHAAAGLDDNGQMPIKAMRHAYWGPSLDDAAIESNLRTYKLRYARLPDPASTAAELLSQGKILGWFQGRMEFGPRALGNRSILADPRDPGMNAKVNNAVKFREWWRPFAPSFKKEAAGDYLESATDSPFMIVTAQVRPEKRSVIPSVTLA